MKRDGATTSIWQYEIEDYISKTSQIPQDVPYDVLIVGGGITGLSTALQLQKAGKCCILVEAHTLGFGTTGGTTAHINTIMESSFDKIKKDFSEDDAKLLADIVKESCSLIESNIHTYNIDCNYAEKTGYVFSQNEDQTKELNNMHSGCLEIGVPCEKSSTIPIPISFEEALTFPNQAQIHPIKYIFGLAKAFEAMGGVIVQHCKVMELDKKDDIIATTTLGNIKTKNVVYATHVPPGVNILHFRCAPYRSYVIAAKLEDNNYPEGLVCDMNDPYKYYRTDIINGEKFLIVGGEDHKTAHEEHTEKCFLNLESYVRKHFNVSSVPFSWSSQYYDSTDGLPYIGELPGFTENVYVATGFGGNGIVYSSSSALILTELIVNGNSKFEKLFVPSRIKPVAGFTNFIKEGADVVTNLLGAWMSAPKLESFASLAPDEAKIVSYEDKKLALYKDSVGNLHAVNSLCSHIKCSISWNSAEKSWDCPCHGSRFSCTGEVLTGPSTVDLEYIDLKN